MITQPPMAILIVGPLTHRASTLALADAIVEVEHGRAVKRPARQPQAA